MSPSKIVITGTIASGKSTISSLLEDYGFKVLSADKINSKLLEEGGANYKAIKDSKQFDEAFVEGILDKKELAKIIFQDKDKRLLINELSHKNIIDFINREIENSNEEVVFIEIPLYFQMKEEFKADEVWLVVARNEVQIQRLMQRDGIDIAYARTKIQSQEELSNMKNKSDRIFDNSTSLENIKAELEKVLKEKDLVWKL